MNHTDIVFWHYQWAKICIALVIFVSWIPGNALSGAFMFAGKDFLLVRMQRPVGEYILYQFFLMPTYALDIVSMIDVARKAE